MPKNVIVALFVVVKIWKMNGCLSFGEWLNKLQYMVIEYYCAKRNDKQDDFVKKLEQLT